MKKILKSIIFAFPALALLSCSFLEVDKIGKTDIESYFSDIYALEGAVNGTSSLLYSYYDRHFILYPEVTGDMVTYSATFNDLRTQYNYESLETEETGAVGYIWRLGYQIISNTNEIIAFGPRLLKEYPQMASRINTAIAQAYFIRALLHLDLALAYSQPYNYTEDAGHLGIAVMDRFPGVTETIRRSTSAQTYAHIVSDLETSLKFFPADYQSVWFPSPLASKALLSRVFLYMGNYSLAADYASLVIDSPGMSLTPRNEYTAMFCSTKSPGKEAIYRLSGVEQTSSLASTFSYTNIGLYPSAKLLGLFPENEVDGNADIRKSLLSYTDKQGQVYDKVCMKYTITDEVSDKMKYVSPFVLRLSEMYLNRAEANCRLGKLDDAAQDIAALRSRATGLSTEDSKPSYSGAEELDRIIITERMKELHLEGHRQFDITRRKENLERDEMSNSKIKFLKYPDDRFILPIPLVELDANKDMQPNPVNSTQR